jgi:hypothetical protein
VGPYTPLNCTLTLLRSTVRKKPDLKSGTKYGRDLSADDDRFIDYVGGTQAIVTSSGTSDAGMFETNLRDERFLPFEGAGAVSVWRLELPARFPTFDPATIADGIVHMRYTARQGGEHFAQVAIDELAAELAKAGESGLALLFSLRHDFPTEWSAFVNTGAATFSAVLKKSYFPYFAQNMTMSVDAVELHTGAGAPITPSLVTADLTTALAGGAATMVLDKVPNDPSAQVFLVIRYSLT